LNEDLNRVNAEWDLHTSQEAYLFAQATAPSLPAQRRTEEAIIHEPETLSRMGDAEAVEHGAKQFLSNWTDPRVAELPDWAETSIGLAPEIRGNGRKRGPLLIWGAIGVMATAFAVAAIIGHSPRPAPIVVQPGELAFSYIEGGNVPQPRALQIKAGIQRWTMASSAPWLRFSKADGMGTSDVEVSVDPSGLSPGEYDTVATVRSASMQKTLRVRLEITGTALPETASLETASPETAPPATTAPSQKVQITPSQLNFSYVRTGPPPAPQRFRIVTIPDGEGWTATGEQTWVLPSRRAGAGTSEIEVRVDGSQLAPGVHSAIVRVSSADSVELLTVLLHVTEPPPLFDPAVNCHGDQYNGRYTGTITWLGPLNDGEVLTIRNKNVASTGRASGRELPGCPVSITSVPALDIQEPSAENNFRQIRFTNKSGHALDSIKITWSVK
jgi:hypothetical protein